MEQGIFGTIFGYGTVLPLTGSGLGTGTDESMIVGGTGTEVKICVFSGNEYHDDVKEAGEQRVSDRNEG